MAKVTMYRGIDPVDGVMTLFAVSGDRMIAALDHDEGSMLQPETFDFSQYLDEPLRNFGEIQNMTVLWEADL